VEIAIVLLVIVVVAVGSALLARRVRHPENAGSHTDTSGDTTTERFHTDPGRPAGPDAEDPIGPTRAG
jgi:hypothetical protein